jgi:hypothetical protein
MYRLLGGLGCVLAGTVFYAPETMSVLAEGYVSFPAIDRLTGLAWGAGLVLLWWSGHDWQTLAAEGFPWRKPRDRKVAVLTEVVRLQLAQLNRPGANGTAATGGGLDAAKDAGRATEHPGELPSEGR